MMSTPAGQAVVHGGRLAGGHGRSHPGVAGAAAIHEAFLMGLRDGALYTGWVHCLYILSFSSLPVAFSPLLFFSSSSSSSSSSFSTCLPLIRCSRIYRQVCAGDAGVVWGLGDDGRAYAFRSRNPAGVPLVQKVLEPTGSGQFSWQQVDTLENTHTQGKKERTEKNKKWGSFWITQRPGRNLKHFSWATGAAVQGYGRALQIPYAHGHWDTKRLGHHPTEPHGGLSDFFFVPARNLIPDQKKRPIYLIFPFYHNINTLFSLSHMLSLSSSGTHRSVAAAADGCILGMASGRHHVHTRLDQLGCVPYFIFI
jgi:hypothetical protein